MILKSPSFGVPRCTSKVVACFQTKGNHIYQYTKTGSHHCRLQSEIVNTCLQISNSLPALGQLVTQCAIISGGWGWGVDWGRDYCLLFPRQPWARFTTSYIWTLEMKEHKIKWKIANRTCGTKAENLNYVFPAQMPIVTLSDRLNCTLLHCIFSAFVLLPGFAEQRWH